MKITSKIFIVFALMCVSIATAYSQDCNTFLRKATEQQSKKNYCEAKKYYQMYKNCDADADVSTEIAMCERLCTNKEAPREEINTGSTTRNETIILTPDRPIVKQTIDMPVKSVSTSPKFKLGLSGGLLCPTKKAEGAARTYLFFGGGICAEYLPTPHIGIGLSAGYYGYEVKYEVKKVEVGKITASLTPLILTGKYYLLTESIQPYAGADVGFYTLGAKEKYVGESETYSISETFFGFAPVVGLQFKLSNALGLDVSAKYNLIFTEGESAKILGINIGIIYTFGK